MTFMCENFHVDHYGALVLPSPGMLQSLESLGYTVSAQFPSAIVSQMLKSKYPKANITVTICKLQRGAEKLELFVVEGLTSSEFCVEARALNHVAFSPNILEKHLVHRFKSIMQESGFLQGSAGINSTELCLYKGLTIQGITLMYFNRSPLNPGPNMGPANLEVCMAGMHPELLETA